MPSTVEIVIKTIDQSTQETKRVGDGWKDLGKSIAAGAAVITASVLAVKKALEFAEEGAQFDLLSQSVENLGIDVETLQDSVGGTIDKFSIMNATATLLAGTQGKLRDALVDSSADLLEIAKAANAVNPALGDTGFLFESLGRGIKRASPLILDNLGLVIKVGEANERMAESLGKTVNELTAEEKQLALLNETIAKGNVLISQAADLNTEAVDTYASMGASITDAWNALKALLAVPLTPLAEQIGAWADLIGLYQEGKISLWEANRAMFVAGTTSATVTSELEFLESQFEETETSIVGGRAALVGYATAAGEAARASEDATEANEDLALSLGDVNLGLDSFIQKQLDTIKFMRRGGGEIQKVVDGAMADYEEGLITLSELNDILEDQAIETALALGEFDDLGMEGIIGVLEEMGIPLRDAQLLANDLMIRLEEMDGATASMFINIVTTGSIPNLPGSGVVPGTNIPLQSGPSTPGVTPGVTVPEQFADGGFMKAGQIGIVGERGPEGFVAPSNGQIISNEDMSRLFGGGSGSISAILAVQQGQFMDRLGSMEAAIVDAVSQAGL